MKTQIITLAPHDDLISVRDRMSWAKSPRILLVWPASEQIPLRPLDLRILQQHAAGLGAQLGLVTRRSGIRRDAASFGIPVFNSTAAAQRAPWPRTRWRRWQRAPRSTGRTAELRIMKDELATHGKDWTSQPIVRIGFFLVAVLAVFSIASLFVPRATVILSPFTIEQSGSVTVEVGPAPGADLLTSGVASQTAEIHVSGSQTMSVQSRLKVPKEKASGIARFQNVTLSPLVIPAGTVVYSATAAPVRFATLEEVQIEGGADEPVEVSIEALEPGAIGNVPADAIQGIEGSLGALMTVTNPAPTQGGRDSMEEVASQADRDHLRADLLAELQGEAELKLASLVAEDAVIIPDTLVMTSVDEELFDPPAGQPGSVLSLTMSATYEAVHVRSADLRGLAEVSLNSSMPAGYTARNDTLEYRMDPLPSQVADGRTRFNLTFERKIARQVDSAAVNLLVRGRRPADALSDLQVSLPLAEPPKLQLAPPWWPWLPLIPFRIDVVIV